ncbi:hypothetical protein J4460_01625 [Candidatus Woesearchaeota archaeon]|nr:MAG: hypothetical protein QS99_C0003G0003 [archaeon GW2011_AR4]MBS3129351.1 hypothetical protein [Candidatus Woesearchaeota archaeon]HIH37618.1 hypothetical protein [Candidatus Woesearchaeota archaeon]HIH48763.1 hypothetical protein [Candidatus Woesearchaeota archaeon]HIJ03575.1 hypothetical protein [Candidatus Woesearchaeota archaeon]
MTYLRTKTIKGKKYYYLVKGVYENGKVRQKVVKYLGSAQKIASQLGFDRGYLREKKIKRHSYYYLVEGKYIDGKVRQKVVKYLGTLERFFLKE